MLITTFLMNADKHRARKRFGQNFLHDPIIIQRIIDAINPQANDHIIEIGPGKGAITQPLLERVQHLDVIEIDRDLAGSLLEKLDAKQTQLTIHQQDALKTDFSRFGTSKLRIIGNLPYNISTPLLFHLLTFSNQIHDMIFMLQKEVVDRICAKSGSKQYGRLSVMLQYYFDVQRLFTVKPGSFIPAPKVDSAIVKLIPFKIPEHKLSNPESFSLIVRDAFSQRRKTIRNALKNYLNDGDFQKINVSPEIRAEKLEVEDFVKLSNYYDQLKNKAL